MRIILASGSPRRRELLTQAGVDFEVMTIATDEGVQIDESAHDYILRMVKQKSQAAIAAISHNSEPLSMTPSLVLTADTIGILPDAQRILTKPTDKADAFEMWQQMSGRSHEVCTAVQATVLAADADTRGEYQPLRILWQEHILERTAVTFVTLSDHEMLRYWQSGEPADKAGGYAIQGGAAAWVSRIDGSYTNVVGLPLAQSLALIDRAKVATHEMIANLANKDC